MARLLVFMWNQGSSDYDPMSYRRGDVGIVYANGQNIGPNIRKGIRRGKYALLRVEGSVGKWAYITQPMVEAYTNAEGDTEYKPIQARKFRISRAKLSTVIQEEINNTETRSPVCSDVDIENAREARDATPWIKPRPLPESEDPLLDRTPP